MIKSNEHDDAAVQSPDYNQSVGWQPFIPHYNAQLQYGYQTTGAGSGPQLLPSTNQQSFFMSPMPGSAQNQGAMGNLAKNPTEEDKIEEFKKKLEKRKIPTNEWQYYIKSPDAWDFNEISSSGLNKGIEVILLSPNTITPYWVDRGSVSRFIQLRGKLTEVIQAKEEIERFVQNEVPEDNQLAAAHKQAGKKAKKLQAEL